MLEIIKNRNVLLASLGFFLIFFGFGPSQQFIIPIFSELGNENIAVVSLALLYGTFAIGTFFTPKLISRIGSRKVFLIAVVLYATYIFFISFQNEYLLYVFSVVGGVGTSLLWVNIGSYIIRIVSEKERGAALGFQTSLFMLGNLTGIGISTILINIFTFQNLFWFLSAFAFLGLVPFLGVKDVKIEIQKKSFKYVLLVFKNSKILLLLPTIIFSFFIWAQSFSSINLIIQKFGLTYVGIAGVIFQVMFLFFAYFLGSLTRNFKKQLILVITLPIGLLGLSTFLLWTDLPIYMFGIAMIAIHVSTVFPVALNFMKDLSKYDAETTAGSFSLTNSVSVLTAFISVIFLKEIVNVQLSFAIGIVALIALIILARKIS